MPHGMRNVSSPTRDHTHTPCIGSSKPEPLDLWGSLQTCFSIAVIKKNPKAPGYAFSCLHSSVCFSLPSPICRTPPSPPCPHPECGSYPSFSLGFIVVQLLRSTCLFVTLWTEARQASLSITISRSSKIASRSKILCFCNFPRVRNA